MATLPSPNNTSNPEAFGYEANLDNLLLRMAAGPGRQLTNRYCSITGTSY